MNKAAFTNNFTHIARYIACNRFANRKRVSKKTYRIIIANGNIITRCSKLKRNFSNAMERISVKKVVELLERVLSILRGSKSSRNCIFMN